MARAAAKVDVPLYAFDDRTALKIVGDKVEIISDREWKLFNEEKIK
jgi:dipeptidase E